MPSALHEFLIELLRAEPEAARHLLASLDEHLVPPDTEVRVSEPVLTPPGPPELRADLILHFHRGDVVQLGVVVEVQLRRDPRKRHAWPLYLAALHARLRCPVLLLVLTPRAEVARWAETVLHLGPGFVLKPFALGPHNHPRITPAQVETVPTAVTLLSGLIHQELVGVRAVERCAPSGGESKAPTAGDAEASSRMGNAGIVVGGCAA